MRQVQVWRYLNEHGPTRPETIAAEFGITKHNTCAILRRLAARGCAKGSGNTWNRSYKALGKRAPADRRGKSLNTAFNLARGRVLGNQALAARRGRLLIPRAKHPLDLAMRG